MTKYIVNVLGLQGRGKKVFGAGEVVQDNQLPEDNAKELVKKGFLKPAKLTAKEKKLDDAQQKIDEAKINLEAANAELNDADDDADTDELVKKVEAAEGDLADAEDALKKLTK